jgi:3',5'-nucleoside bisphosphate phosphatase
MYVDMHMHTYYSDGTNSPRDNVLQAALIGIDMIAITDHDITDGYHQASIEAQKWDIKIIPGVEISTKQYHILGYGFDIANKEFQELLAHSRKLQEQTVAARIRILQGANIPITYEKVKEFFPKSRIGKKNIAMTLMLDIDCRKYLGKRSLTDVFYPLLGKGGIAYDVDDEQLTPKQAIDGIHNAGGLAVIAHPFKDVESMSELDDLLKLGLDGIEVQPNYKGKNKPFKKYAQEHGLLITYGSDYHGAHLFNRPLLELGNNKLNIEDLENRLTNKNTPINKKELIKAAV